MPDCVSGRSMLSRRRLPVRAYGTRDFVSRGEVQDQVVQAAPMSWRRHLLLCARTHACMRQIYTLCGGSPARQWHRRARFPRSRYLRSKFPKALLNSVRIRCQSRAPSRDSVARFLMLPNVVAASFAHSLTRVKKSKPVSSQKRKKVRNPAR